MAILYAFFLIILSLINCEFDFGRYFISFSEDEKNKSQTNPAQRIRKELIGFISGSITDVLEDLVNNAAPEDKEELEQCKNVQSIFDSKKKTKEDNNTRDFFIHLLYYDASKSKNDLSPYLDCIESQTFYLADIEITDEQKNKYIKESTYMFFKLKEKNNKSFTDFTFKDNEFLFGICIKKGLIL